MSAIGRAILITAVLSTCGCLGFERDWRAAEQCCTNPNDIAGLWEGTWLSHHNGHEGSLRAIITRNADGSYYAKFHATYLEVVPFGFEMPLSVSENGDVRQLGGTADLGLLAGGVYRYAGEANACHLVANFCAKSDHGVFKLTRVATCGCGNCDGCDSDPCDVCTPPNECGSDACGAKKLDPVEAPAASPKPYEADSTSARDASAVEGLTGAGANRPARISGDDQGVAAE